MQDEEKNGTLEASADEPVGAEVKNAEPASAAEPPRNPNMKWYIIHSYSGFERMFYPGYVLV